MAGKIKRPAKVPPAAATPQTIFPLASRPGIKRDGTTLQGDACTGGQWVRFQRGLPRKIGGYGALSWEFSGPVRGCFVFARAGTTYVYAGSSDALEYSTIVSETAAGVMPRTPSGFTASANNVWQFDAMFDAGSSTVRLIAHGAPNLLDIDSTTQRPVYYGTITDTAVLTSTGQSVSGGACVLAPYLFLYDSDGLLKWSDANTPATFTGGDSGSARVTSSKIVKGLRTRGGPSNSPSGLFWSLDTLIRASYVGGSAIFRFDEISGQSSILSSSGPIEYDSVYYWPGEDRFLMYNGVVQEVPNDMNINWFYDNLNWTYRQKVWAMKVPRYGEIWWFYPRGDNTECSDAIIYNVREKTWYDAGTVAPGAARSAGNYARGFRYPLMFGLTTNDLTKYQLFRHEYGVDEVYENAAMETVTNAIQSFFDSRDIALPATGPMEQWVGQEQQIELDRVEPDFVQTGEMTMTVLGQQFARSTAAEKTKTFSATDEKIDVREQSRIKRLRFESNVAGGDFETGQVLLHFKPGQTRP